MGVCKIMFKTFLTESSSLVVVDIQPGHKAFIQFDIYEFCRYLNDFKGHIDYIFNGPELGYDKKTTVEKWLRRHGLKRSVNYIEKEYGWLRDAMDYGVDKYDIIDVLQYMIKQDVEDSRDIEREQLNKLRVNQDFIEALVEENVSIFLPEILPDLQKMKPTVIIGGGDNECLTEVELTLAALKKRPTRNPKYIY